MTPGRVLLRVGLGVVGGAAGWWVTGPSGPPADAAAPPAPTQREARPPPPREPGAPPTGAPPEDDVSRCVAVGCSCARSFADHPEQDLRGEVDAFLAEARSACPELAPRLLVDCDEPPCLLAVDLLDGEPSRLPPGCDHVGEHALRRADAFAPRPERGQRLVFVVPRPSAGEEPDRRQRMRVRRLQERP